MHNLAGSESEGERTDERLLHDYLGGQDPGAFAAIVRRHGPMVLGVCRRVLRAEQDAEDAFQATFVVLMRRARSLNMPHLLANWLHGVAYRTASKMRSANRRQRSRTAPLEDVAAPEADEVLWRDVRVVLDDELERLPPRYRRPLVLFYLEGHSAEDVASKLGCPKGTVLSQLARGRDRLRVRLFRRGLALSTGLLATFLLKSAAVDAALPQTLIDWSMCLPQLPAAAQLIEQGLSLQAQRAAREVLKELVRRKLLMLGSVVVTIGLGLGLGVVGYRAYVASPVVPAVLAPVPDAASEVDRLQGTWEVATVTYAGEVLPKNRFPFARLKVGGDTVVEEGDNGRLEMSLRVDPGHDPKWLDMEARSFHRETYHAIYNVDGDLLTICRREPDMERPTQFVSKPNTSIFLITARRVANSRP